MKNILFAFIFYIIRIFAIAIAMIFSLKQYVETNFPNGAELKIKNSTVIINDTEVDIFGLQISNVWFIFTNLAIFFFIYLYQKNNKFTQINIKLKYVLYSVIIYLIYLSFEYFAVELNLVKYDYSFRIMFTESTLINFLIVCNVVLFTAVIEEFIFRHLLLNGLISVTKHKFVSVLISSFLFAILHLQYHFTVIVMIFVSSLIVSFIYLKYDKNLFYPILIHSLNNLLAFWLY